MLISVRFTASIELASLASVTKFQGVIGYDVIRSPTPWYNGPESPGPRQTPLGWFAPDVAGVHAVRYVWIYVVSFVASSDPLVLELPVLNIFRSAGQQRCGFTTIALSQT